MSSSVPILEETIPDREGSSFDLEAYRRDFPILETTIPLNNCSQAPQSLRTRAAARAYLDSWNDDGMDWERWIGEVEEARAEFAALINASRDEIAICSSVSAATAGLASALDFGEERRRVVLSPAEFPSVAHVWLAHRKYGAEIEWVQNSGDESEIEAYERSIDRRTRLVSACHADYRDGTIQDLRSISERAHAAGARLYVDAYQTLGIRRVDVDELGADFLAAGNLKYLMGVPGVAFLYVRRELIEDLHPAVTGWFGRADPFAFAADRLDWSPDAARFDTGTPALLSAYVARAGMAMIREVGLGTIEDRTRDLARRLIRGGLARGLELEGPRDDGRRTPLTAFACPRDLPGGSQAVEAALRERGILASARGRAVRLAPHFYNTTEEIELALDALVTLFETEGAA